MANHDFELIGQGKYAAVYHNDNYPYVIKVFMRDTAYLKWLAFCAKHQNNRFIPKIRGKVIRITSLFMAIRLERLTRFSSMYDTKTFSTIQNLADLPDVSDQDLAEIQLFFRQNRQLIDIHQDNLMMRNNQVVIVDPLYNWFNNDKFTIDPNDLTGLEYLF